MLKTLVKVPMDFLAEFFTELSQARALRKELREKERKVMALLRDL